MTNDLVFRPTFGNRPDQIVGREQIIGDFLEGLSSQPGHPNRVVLMLGQRGMGKTAILLELADQASKNGFVVARVTANKNMLEEIIETIQLNGSAHIKKEKSKVKGFNAGALGFSFGLTFTEEVRDNYGFRVKLSLLCDKLAESGFGVLILVDEVQASSDEMRTLATTFQHLVGDNKNIAIVMAGLPSAISDVLNDDILTFLNRATKVRLTPLSLTSIGVYYEKTFARLGKAIDQETLDKAVRATKGFPYLLQLIGYYILEYTDDSSAIADDIVDKAIDCAKQALVENVFAASLRPLSDADRAFLNAMAEDEEGKPSRVSDIVRRLQKPENYVQVYRTRLLDSGIIVSPRRGELEFTLPYVSDYLAGRL